MLHHLSGYSSGARGAVGRAVLLILGSLLLNASAVAQPLLEQTLASPNEELNGWSGYSVAGMPDVTGDGLGDLLVGAPQDDPGASLTDCGRAYIFDGATGALVATLASANEETAGRFGWTVGGVPDVNGDGRGDAVVGAYQEDPGAAPGNAGRAYILDGVTGAVLWTLASPNEETSGEFGRAVAGVPDVNGDGRGDVVVGAYIEDPGASPTDAGRAYVFDGATGALLHALVSPNEETSGYFGAAVAGMPDVTGDGRGDVIVGAYRENPGASPTDAGRAYIFDGASGALFATFASPNEETSGLFGYAVSGLDDVTGDSLGDLVVGAPDEDPGASPSSSGRAYVFNGATGALVATLASPNEESAGRLGWSVGAAPDVDGDGDGDVIAGAYQEDPGAAPTNAGRAYVFSGATGALLATLASPNEEDTGAFGYYVAGVADATGDGRGDFLVGAYLEDPDTSPDGAGRTYLFALDLVAPESAAAITDATQAGGTIDATYTEGDFGGSGVASVTLYVRPPAGAWTNAGAVSGGVISYAPSAGDGAYDFATVATDNRANVETAPAGADPGDVTILWNEVPNSTYEHAIGADGEYYFPMEETLDVRVSVLGVTTGGTLTVSRTEGNVAATGLPAAGFIDQSWTITAAGGLAFADGKLRLEYDEALLGELSEPQIDRAWRDDAGSVTEWPIILDTLQNAALIEGITAFSSWYLGNEVLVPVELSAIALD